MTNRPMRFIGTLTIPALTVTRSISGLRESFTTRMLPHLDIFVKYSEAFSLTLCIVHKLTCLYLSYNLGRSAFSPASTMEGKINLQQKHNSLVASIVMRYRNQR